jgi:hypothetical protein
VFDLREVFDPMADGFLMSIAEQSAHFLAREHTGRPTGPVLGPSAWTGAELGPPDVWAERLTPELISSLETKMTTLEGRSVDGLTMADAVLPGFEAHVDGWREELLRGRGILVLKGVPVDRWSPAQQQLFMRLLGLQFGRLGYQNPQGDVIGEVRDTGADKRDRFARLYATAGEFRFHCDASDLVGLLCVRPAAEGGQSKVASSVTVYNELLRRRPDLAARMFEPIALDLRNEQQPDAPPVAYIAPCAYADGVLKTLYLSDYFRTAARHIDLPPKDLELFDLYDAIAEEPGIGLSFFLEPGDVQILYNHTMLHARTAFRDAPGEERLLLRFLVSVGVSN